MPQAVGGDSAMPSISREGRWVTFESAATNLVADDLNGARDVFLVDRLTNDIRLISRGPGGVVGNAASYAAAISGNGAVVAFVSEASNLVPGSAGSGVYLYDRATSQTSRVPLAAGVRANTHEGLRRLISLSADGRFIAFGAHEEPATAYSFVMLFDRVQGSLTKFAIGPTIGAYGLHPRLNAAGNLLAVEFYELQTKGGMPLTTIATRSRFVRVIDLANSAAQDLFPPAPWSGVDCGFPSISDSGRWVTYECRNVPDPSPSRFARIYLHDRVANTSIEISTPPTGVTRRHSLAPEISADGRFVAFTSFTPLVSGVTGEPGQVYRYDRNTGAIELVSKDLFGVPFFRGAFAVALDATGTLVALTTPEPVDPSDTNLRADVYLVDPSCQYAVTRQSRVPARWRPTLGRRRHRPGVHLEVRTRHPGLLWRRFARRWHRSGHTDVDRSRQCQRRTSDGYGLGCRPDDDGVAEPVGASGDHHPTGRCQRRRRYQRGIPCGCQRRSRRNLSLADVSGRQRLVARRPPDHALLRGDLAAVDRREPHAGAVLEPVPRHCHKRCGDGDEQCRPPDSRRQLFLFECCWRVRAAAWRWQRLHRPRDRTDVPMDDRLVRRLARRLASEWR